MKIKILILSVALLTFMDTIQLQNQIADMQTKIESLNQRLGLFASNPNDIDRYESANAKSIIGDIIADQMLDLTWQRTTRFITFFESIDGYSITASGGGGVATGHTNLELATAASNGNVAAILKDPDTQGNFSFGFRSFFRTTARITTSGGSVANLTAYYCLGTIGNENYGFKWASGNLLGFTSHGGAETTKTIVTSFVSGTAYNLEAQFFPGNRVDFYVNGILKGSSTTNLPTTTNFALINIQLTTNENHGQTLDTSFFEYMQERNLTNFNF